MHEAENAFLSRVRAALGKTETPTAPQALNAALPKARPEGELDELLRRSDRTRKDRLKLLEELKKSAAPLNLGVHAVRNVTQAGKVIADLARERDTEWGGEKRIVRHDTELMSALRLEKQLPDDIAVDVARMAAKTDDEQAEKQRLREMAEAAYMGVTGADWCAVDCGAIALLCEPGKPRHTSLVPSIHVAVLRLTNLLADLPETFAKLEETHRDDKTGPLPASVQFISGPSKTADIEAELVHGAHGPREMHLVVITG